MTYICHVRICRFVVSPKAEILVDLGKQIESNNKEASELKVGCDGDATTCRSRDAWQQKKAYLERSYQEREDAFKELITLHVKRQ